ncbi:MAG: hypothetical protein Pg6C_05900 [Treponemataceae bacterium]|nr:MAG: hypothetical protein Pg6C_05900 [Treponemataceae bacterium]
MRRPFNIFSLCRVAEILTVCSVRTPFSVYSIILSPQLYIKSARMKFARFFCAPYFFRRFVREVEQFFTTLRTKCTLKYISGVTLRTHLEFFPTVRAKPCSPSINATATIRAPIKKQCQFSFLHITNMVNTKTHKTIYESTYKNPKRRVVERMSSRQNKARRVWKNCEHTTRNSCQMLVPALIE